MDNKISNIKSRILQFANYKGISNEKFCEKIGMTYGAFKGTAKHRPINSDALERIFALFPDVNIGWLLTGEGEMIRDSSFKYSNEELEKILESNNKLIADLLKTKNEYIDLMKEVQKLKDELYYVTRNLETKKKEANPEKEA